MSAQSEKPGSEYESLLPWLNAFNRKERFFLASQAVGGFRLSRSFRRNLAEIPGVPVIPDAKEGDPISVFVGTDYHLDWIYAALHLAKEGRSPDSSPAGSVADLYVNDVDFRALDAPTKSGEPEHVYLNTNQEDIDLLVAFRQDDVHHLILIEAKGATPWSNKQMTSKAWRLKTIFEHVNLDYVKPVLVLASPREPGRLWHPEKNQPSWVVDVPPWIWSKKVPDTVLGWRYMSLDSYPKNPWWIVQTDDEGNPKKGGGYWKADTNPPPAEIADD